MKSKAKKWIRKGKAFGIALSVYCLSYVVSYAQDGNAGINAASTQVRSYFDTGTQLMYAIGAVVGLIGAVKVYQKWNVNPIQEKLQRPGLVVAFSSSLLLLC
jgi:hypothetical protein